MSDREKFEEFAKGEGYNLTTHGEDYWYPATVTAWKLWQAAISSRDSTPTEGVGKRVVSEWWDGTADAVDHVGPMALADLAQRIDRALAAPRMTLDLRRFVASQNVGILGTAGELISYIRAQLRNVDIITEES